MEMMILVERRRMKRSFVMKRSLVLNLKYKLFISFPKGFV
jgi:hypothetical protein